MKRHLAAMLAAAMLAAAPCGPAADGEAEAAERAAADEVLEAVNGAAKAEAVSASAEAALAAPNHDGPCGNVGVGAGRFGPALCASREALQWKAARQS